MACKGFLLVTLAWVILALFKVTGATKTRRQTDCEGESGRFKTRRTFVYNYEAVTETTLAAGGSRFWSKLSCKLQINSPVGCLLSMSVSECTFSSVERETKPAQADWQPLPHSRELAQELEKSPLYFRQENGLITRLYPLADDAAYLVNIKRGMLSPLQLRVKEGYVPDSESYSYLGAHGQCNADYRVTERNSDDVPTKMAISKNLADCVQPTSDEENNIPSGATQECEYTLKSSGSGMIDHVTCRETFPARSQDGDSARSSVIVQKHRLLHVKSLPSSVTINLDGTRVSDLAYEEGGGTPYEEALDSLGEEYSDEECRVKVGIESGFILDTQLSASSSYDNTTGPENGRIGMPSAWVPNVQNKRQWFQVDFRKRRVLTGITTQGRGNFNQWVTRYKVEHRKDDTSDWTTVTNEDGQEMVFEGNSDDVTPVTRSLPQRINTQFVRIRPKSWHGGIALRLEILACPRDTNCTEAFAGGMQSCYVRRTEEAGTTDDDDDDDDTKGTDDFCRTEKWLYDCFEDALLGSNCPDDQEADLRSRYIATGAELVEMMCTEPTDDDED
ncbi:PREDICTED: uncharacterized protein LOC109479727 [Branchiostoma belcheri]|uniref:Uncharacterized protein LOC109479727 n=1 Tax=Branchiostoma belcheri TaxID=7741 RepID=A0A6P4Z791_BRABE|nr:PREDICTED: uncharacterized protein LOC109479727 [Branchiostoma belcheri]